MPVSYSKWDNIDDSDDDDAGPADADALEKGPAMDEFLSLGRDASVAEIQEKIRKLPAETKESLLRHEKGGLLQRMMGLDANKSYEAGEIFGTAKPTSAAAAPATAPASAKKNAPAASANNKAALDEMAAALGVKAPSARSGAAAGGATKPPRGSSSSSKPKTAALKPTRCTDSAAATSSGTNSTPSSTPSSTPRASAVSPSTKASTDYSKFDRIVDITEEVEAAKAAAAAGKPLGSESATAAAAEAATTLDAPSARQAAGGSAVSDGMAAQASAAWDAAAATATKPPPPSSSSAAPAPASPAATHAAMAAEGLRSFSFVRVPHDVSAPIEVQTGFDLGDGEDVLPTLLAPLFKSNLALDEAAVAHRLAGHLETMRAERGMEESDPSRADPASLPGSAPRVSELEAHAKGGVCEAWPLAPATEDNGWNAVKLYIDEVGALRKRPRNARAEALAAAAGQAVLAIHGDAYVGRTRLDFSRVKYGGECLNVDFGREELSPDCDWVRAEKAARERQGKHDRSALAPGERPPEAQYASGGVQGADGGEQYSWSQGEEDVEVRLRQGVPTGANAKRRVRVSYGKGQSLTVAVDGEAGALLELPRLYGRVKPAECSWCLDGTELVVTLEKVDARPWVDLCALAADKDDGE